MRSIQVTTVNCPGEPQLQKGTTGNKSAYNKRSGADHSGVGFQFVHGFTPRMTGWQDYCSTGFLLFPLCSWGWWLDFVCYLNKKCYHRPLIRSFNQWPKSLVSLRIWWLDLLFHHPKQKNGTKNLSHIFLSRLFSGGGRYSNPFQAKPPTQQPSPSLSQSAGNTWMLWPL